MESKYLWAFGCFVFMVATVYLANVNDVLGGRLESLRIELGHRELDLQLANSNIERLQGELAQTRIELADAENELDSAREELASTQEELNLTLAALVETRWELVGTQAELEGTRAEFEQLGEEMAGLSESIHSSIQWFRENSVLPPSMNYLYREVNSECVDGGTLNLGCSIFIMEREIPFEYREEYPDRLYSLLEMEGRRSGDCEDYSLLMKSLLNRFRAEGRNVEIEAWEEGSGRYIIYEDGRTTWYMPGEGREIGNLLGMNPYVVCFVTGFVNSQFQGHCIVAMGGKVGKVGEIPNLGGAETFEPQTGEYKGKVGVDYYLCRDGEEECGKMPGEIVFIIADNDLYHFEEGRWIGYELYGERAEELGRKIREFTG